MKLQLPTSLQFIDVPAAMHVFKACPVCRRKDLLSFEEEVFCTSCDWNSIEWRVEAQLNAQIARHRSRKQIEPKQADQFQLPRRKSRLVKTNPLTVEPLRAVEEIDRQEAS